MKTQVKMLKVKIKSLAEEARIIRLEELRAMPHSKPRPREGKNGTAAIRPGLWVEKYADPELQRSLWLHRTVDLRQEQRSAMIAYAFLRGKLYRSVERKAASAPNLKRVRELVRKFGPIRGNAEESIRLEEWIAAPVAA
jgi:hypothetical protein